MMVGLATQGRQARRARRRLLGPDPTLRLTGHRGATERREYLQALADDVLAGRCTRADAITELEELSTGWLREVVCRRLRRLPARADAHTTEHWMWVEWRAALERFDPSRVDTFPSYVALRLRMAVSAAAREDDPLSRRERAAVNVHEQTKDALMQALGRGLLESEERALLEALVDEGPRSARRRPADAAELVAMSRLAPDPAEDVVRHAVADDVRSIIRTARGAVAGPLLQWLESADGHDKHPPRHLVATVPVTVRSALAPLRAVV